MMRADERELVAQIHVVFFNVLLDGKRFGKLKHKKKKKKYSLSRSVKELEMQRCEVPQCVCFWVTYVCTLSEGCSSSCGCCLSRCVLWCRAQRNPPSPPTKQGRGGEEEEEERVEKEEETG